jgi:hypothetical protein
MMINTDLYRSAETQCGLVKNHTEYKNSYFVHYMVMLHVNTSASARALA